ncbi:MAG: FecR family protein [Betaproteobacteria bacterium]|nr:FecR family protein [Betaproteobacteria bacterium]
MTIIRSAHYALAAAALVFSAQAFADATITWIKGDVRVGNDAANANQRVFSGATINTGIGAQAVLKFDDQQQVVLNENTTFRIADFRYRPAEPRSDRVVFDLLRGALRFITGIVGARNPNVVALRVPQATIGIRGTDFMVALVNPAYVNVISGAVSTTNAGGSVVFGAGSIGQVPSASTLAAPISSSALPPAASSAFSNLAAAQVTPAVAPAAAGSATSGAATSGATAAPSAGVGAAVTFGIGAALIGTAVKDSTTTTRH